MVFAIALILLVIGSVLFHFISPWYLTPLASNWGTIDTTLDITFWVTGVVFVAINLFMAWCVIKFRYNKNRRSHYQPENKKLEIWLTVGTAIGVAAMLTPGLYVWPISSIHRKTPMCSRLSASNGHGVTASPGMTVFWELSTSVISHLITLSA